MISSDSNPIQFWDIDEETFNEKQICGVYKACFCQQFECDDTIGIQFTEVTANELQLVVYDSESEEINSIDLEEISEGVFGVSMVPNQDFSPPLCQKVFLKIIGTYFLDNEDFETNLNSWTQAESGNAWAWNSDGGDGSAMSSTTGIVSSKYLVQSLSISPTSVKGIELTLNFEFNVTVSSAGNSKFRVYGVKDSIFTEMYELPISFSGLVTISDVDLPLGDYDSLAFRLVAETGEHIVDIHYLRIVYTQYEKKSDCIDLKESHSCTELISYTNSTDFDGIDYETASPAPIFYLRVPAQFWKENNPQEQEDSELSNGVIVTRRQSIQEKTLLEIGYVPNYLHKKIQKVLMHETVSINEVTYKRRDPYESENIDRYPLKRASVWLTKYDSVEKNTI